MRGMDFVLTPDDVADRLDLEPDQVERLIEGGFLSGFYLGDHWRMLPSALVDDLDRMQAQLRPVASPDLAPFNPDGARSFPLDSEPKRTNPPDTLDRNGFAVCIELENATDYDGEFILYLGAESHDDDWTAPASGGQRFVDGELLVRRTIAPGDTVTLYESTLYGALGDRLFLSIPEQAAVDVEVDRVFVLDDDLFLRLCLTKRGLLGGRRSVKIRHR